MQIEIHNITKKFNDKIALNDVSFSIKSNEPIALLGKNGSGKTTMLRIILGILYQDQGQVLINGKKINHENIKVGYLPEEQGLYQDISVYDQLIYLASLHDLSIKQSKKEVDYWLRKLDILEYKTHKLNSLSKGNQQKVQLIQALFNNPDLIILDEPFSGIDPLNAILIKEVISEQINKGKIVLISSHQLYYIEELCKKIVILNNGTVVIEENIKDILEKKASTYSLIFDEEKDIARIKKLLNGLANIILIDNKKMEIELLGNNNINDVMKKLLNNSINLNSIYKEKKKLVDLFVDLLNNIGEGDYNE